VVHRWTGADDIPPEAVGVCARTNATVERVRQALTRAGLPVAGDGRPAGVRVETMHGMKGLEFRAVAMVDVSAAAVPPAVAVTPADQDALRHQQDLQRERCLLYVAATRAREQLRVSWSGAPSALLVVQ
jgi:superfamily I DNA/RNA helicase